MTPTIYTYIFLVALAAIFPKDAMNFALWVNYQVQLHYVNQRMKFISWCMHRKLTRMCKEAGFPTPGPFRYIPLWERDMGDQD